MPIRKIGIRLGIRRNRGCAPLCAPLFAIRDPQSKLDNSQGGIAQLVERQLCKLEVRGSNPLASSLRSRRGGERRLSRRSFRGGGQRSESYE